MLNTLLITLLTVFLFSTAQADDKKAFDAHATRFNYFFTDGDMDFHFGNLVLGATQNGGAEIGEAFYAASRIKDGDAATWQKEWYELAQRVEKRGLKSLEEGHSISARDHLLRAAYYYRISLLGIVPPDPEFAARGLRCRNLMKKLGPLFDPPLEYIEVPFEDTVLPGFFRKAENAVNPSKTLLMIGGGETFIEDLFFYIEPQTHARGYNFITIDLPGQGLLPLSGHIFRSDTHVALKKVVDYVLTRPEVDPDKLAAYGISGGGLFVPQLAMHDARVKAIAMNSGVIDAQSLFATMPAALATPAEQATWSSFHADIVKSICWRYGVDKPSDLIEANKGNTFDPAKIEVPALLIVGEGEYQSNEVKQQQTRAINGFEDTRSMLIVTPSDEGASNHCIMENRSIVGQVLFDWLDEIVQ